MPLSSKEKITALKKTGYTNETAFFQPLLMHFAARFAGHTYAQFASDYKALVDSNIKCMEYFQTDSVCLVSDPYRETSAFGAKVTFLDEAVPRCEDKLITSLDDVKALKNPDLYKCERTLDRIKGAEEFRKRLESKISVVGWIEGPLAEACDLAGVSEMLMQLIMEPDFTKMLLEKTTITAIDFAKTQIQAGCDTIGMGDAICSQISPETYEELVLPLHTQIIESIHSLGAAVKLHICGNITHLLPLIRKAGPDILDCDWMVNMEKAHEILGPDIILCGNLNPVALIECKPENEVFNAANELCLKEKGGSFILSGGCEITVNTPIENLTAMNRALRLIS